MLHPYIIGEKHLGMNNTRVESGCPDIASSSIFYDELLQLCYII